MSKARSSAGARSSLQAASRSSEHSEWDPELLLRNLDHFAIPTETLNLELTGFDTADYDRLRELSLLARNISEYSREVLKEQFLASLNGNSWTERNESIPRFARWLGFRRTGPNIEDGARSVINSLIRADRLEKMGSQIRRI